MKAKIGISENNLAQVALSLSKILADEYLLLTKTKKAYWTIEGADFYEKRKFFKEQALQIDVVIDKLAERIRTFGHFPPASLKKFLELTHLTEDDRGKNDSNTFIKALLADHESLLIQLRANLKAHTGDEQNIGGLLGLIEVHETIAWTLSAHLS
jgi:starvation-inducible DNA-binding protein